MIKSKGRLLIPDDPDNFDSPSVFRERPIWYWTDENQGGSAVSVGGVELVASGYKIYVLDTKSQNIDTRHRIRDDHGVEWKIRGPFKTRNFPGQPIGRATYILLELEGV